MQAFELYYARLEFCAYNYVLVRLSGKQRDKISPGSFKIAIVYRIFLELLNTSTYNISQDSRLSSQIHVLFSENFKARKKIIKFLECVELYLKSYLYRVPYSVEAGHLLLSGMYEGQS